MNEDYESLFQKIDEIDKKIQIENKLSDNPYGQSSPITPLGGNVMETRRDKKLQLILNTYNEAFKIPFSAIVDHQGLLLEVGTTKDALNAERLGAHGADLFETAERFNDEIVLNKFSPRIGFYMILQNWHEIEGENYSVLISPIEKIGFLILIMEQNSDWDGIGGSIQFINQRIRESLQI